MNAEGRRLVAARTQAAPWRKWGPYLSERQWGTVREDYGTTGDAWTYLSHDISRSFAYRWGEDGIAGISDDCQTLCFALALWNGRDPIVKERLFGLTNHEGNHGEDVKEYYFYLDSTPTHSYMRYLYKYPQAPFPYDDLVATNRQRSRTEPEYELIDTGVFDDDRYFDVFVEYAKADSEDLLIEISAFNRGPEPATLHLLPTLWFRNTWRNADAERPVIQVATTRGTGLEASSRTLGKYVLRCESGAELLFVDNETNPERWRAHGVSHRGDPPAFFKDGINDFLVGGRNGAINPERVGTKAAAHYALPIAPGGQHALRLRLTSLAHEGPGSDDDAALGKPFAKLLELRRREADEFYATVIPKSLSDDRGHVVRQALAGMLWTKQFYDYDVGTWLSDHDAEGSAPGLGKCRNSDWSHMVSDDVISMPDKWEYPCYAAWDLAFHSIPLALVDPDFAKKQLLLLLQERYLHPTGQVPAYEWNFGDVNPPVHAWAAYFLYQTDRRNTGHGDLEFLRSAYNKLLLNFTWWVNRKDPTGRNVFDGGFLGLDHIGVVDRSAPLPTGGYLEQADGTAWMAFYAQSMLQISLELALEDRSYVDMALKFFEHFVWIASAMIHIGGKGEMWDEEDGFFYDVLRTPDGRARKLRVRSMVGLLPLCAATVVSEEVMAALPELQQRAGWFAHNRPHMVTNIHDPRRPGYHDRRLLSLLSEERLRRVLARMLDENEFLSPFGIRSLSRHHLEHPYVLAAGDHRYKIAYLPAESDSGVFGGNSNWRGPVWLPVNTLLVRALLNYYAYYGPNFTVEYPTGSGHRATLYEVAHDITERLARIFTIDSRGRRPVFGAAPKFTDDRLWRDHLLFYEYFHGDNGAGIGASHQTGWTGLIASLLHFFATESSADVLNLWPRTSAAAAASPAWPRPRPGEAERRT
jgi:Mannosylglycerate hydrolase MGH1-like glycoside hydrolase domain